jgi:hypothetical protein
MIHGLLFSTLLTMKDGTTGALMRLQQTPLNLIDCIWYAAVNTNMDLTLTTVFKATGMYTNSWDPNNGQILRSVDRGRSWEAPSKLPFKVGGNMPGRGM